MRVNTYPGLRHLMAGLLWIFTWLLAPQPIQADEMMVYGARAPYLIQPLLNAFTHATGIAVHYEYADAPKLLERLQQEGEQSPADLLLMSDVGLLVIAKQAGLLQAVSSAPLTTLIAPSLRDADNQWFGLSLRARAIIYAPDRIGENIPVSYADLAAPRYAGRLCMRSARSVYNQSLVAALLERWGEARTLAWVRGVVANFAQPPEGGDRDQIRAVAAGRCDLTVANTYYYAGMMSGDEVTDREAAARVQLIWPDIEAEGVHINVSAGGVVRYSPHPQLALSLLEFLTQPHAQRLFAQQNQEYPVVAGIPVSRTLVELGPFVADQLPLSHLGARYGDVARITAEAGWH